MSNKARALFQEFRNTTNHWCPATSKAPLGTSSVGICSYMYRSALLIVVFRQTSKRLSSVSDLASRHLVQLSDNQVALLSALVPYISKKIAANFCYLSWNEKAIWRSTDWSPGQGLRIRLQGTKRNPNLQYLEYN